MSFPQKSPKSENAPGACTINEQGCNTPKNHTSHHSMLDASSRRKNAMKKKILYGLTIIALNATLLTNVTQTKPDYCYVALGTCVYRCYGEMPFLPEWCSLGCELGFFGCGGIF
jgi:hypothetical protein